jgi:hypothetical protein
MRGASCGLYNRSDCSKHASRNPRNSNLGRIPQMSDLVVPLARRRYKNVHIRTSSATRTALSRSPERIRAGTRRAGRGVTSGGEQDKPGVGHWRHHRNRRFQAQRKGLEWSHRDQWCCRNSSRSEMNWMNFRLHLGWRRHQSCGCSSHRTSRVRAHNPTSVCDHGRGPYTICRPWRPFPRPGESRCHRCRGTGRTSKRYQTRVGNSMSFLQWFLLLL